MEEKVMPGECNLEIEFSIKCMCVLARMWG